jgi:catechol 2,3-dioxygenase-like lactoylglutathione lyase family enzyme
VARTVQVVIDCHDPDTLAHFWADTLGYQLEAPPAGYASWPDWLVAVGVPEDQWNSRSAIVDPDGVGPRLFFQQVPEDKSVKNRLHLDVRVGTRGEDNRAKVDAEVARLKGRGATEAWAEDTDNEYFVVLRDPEGNEFCVT